MNVCYITNFFPPIQTGTSYYVKDLSNAVARHGNLVLVIAPECDGSLAEEDNEGVKVVRVPSLRLPRTSLLMGFDQFYLVSRSGLFRHLQRLFNLYEVDIIHLCGHLLDFTFWTWLVARRVKLPVVCSIHTVIQYPRNLFLDRILRFLDRNVIAGFGPHRFQGIIALDDVIRNYVKETYPNAPVTVIPYGLNLDPNVRKSADAFNSEALQVVSVGHITDMRDRCDLIRAVHCLIMEGLHVQLSIIGKKCTNRPMHLVRDLGIEKNVVFTGELPRGEIIEYLLTSDLEAHWIINPGLGTATLEAMGHGLPCLAFGYERLFDGIPLKDGKNIFFVRPGDVSGIVSRLRELYYCPINKKAEIGEEARNLVQSFFAWPSIARKLESYYQKTVDEYNNS